MNHVLIIEDEKSIAEVQRDYLEMSGYRVTIILDGTTGLNTALTEDVDLVLLDVMLPGMDGFSICKAIRKEKDIPVIMVTAKVEDIDKIRGLGLGADDYIVKPFSPSELVARVKAHLARYQRLVGKLDHDIQIRGLHIDRKSRRVKVNEEEIVLTTKEFNLLAFLAQNPDHVFSKEQLFDRIWGFDSVGDISTVTVHIRKIREKIEQDPSQPQYLETVWGAGYRFIK
ncbi:response regulator transcription factor [Halobacillus naozhouensis]|uniref:Response regulator transcription factor n=1 Tax=Halobacillus naozhouensis TaxID=554880 RepID=A0ABY8J3K3_9BACI|nr:response regulator transcription factor [Halobacillus naozhouensis]WFT75441.1 response regulator transcription factor [Halobacillus naozhouensis]